MWVSARLMVVTVLMQKAYTLATSCTLAEHDRRPDHKPCLSLAQALLRKGYASLEAAAQQPAAEQDILVAKKELLTLVRLHIPDTRHVCAEHHCLLEVPLWV